MSAKAVVRRTFGAVITTAACLLAACTNSPTAPSTPEAATSIEVFAGTLAPNTSAFYSINVAQAGTISLTLASIAGTNGRPALSTVLRIGYGVPQGTGCQVLVSADTTPSLTAQLSTPSPAGTFCIEIRDVGNLAQSSTFAVRVVHP